MSEKIYKVELTSVQLSLLTQTLELYLKMAAKSGENLDVAPEEELFKKLKELKD